MKASEWQNFFAQQRASHGKVVFSVPELANASRTSPHALNTELGRLLERGLIVRYAQGRYGAVEGVRPEDILPEVDSGAYISGFSALYRYHLVTQAPTEITCFTDRRHNRDMERVTPVGRFRFIRVPRAIYAKPRGAVLASAEQALCDYVWLNLRDHVEPQSLVTFRNVYRLGPQRLHKILRRYPAAVQETVGKIVAGVRP